MGFLLGCFECGSKGSCIWEPRGCHDGMLQGTPEYSYICMFLRAILEALVPYGAPENGSQACRDIMRYATWARDKARACYMWVCYIRSHGRAYSSRASFSMARRMSA